MFNPTCVLDCSFPLPKLCDVLDVLHVANMKLVDRSTFHIVGFTISRHRALLLLLCCKYCFRVEICI